MTTTITGEELRDRFLAGKLHVGDLMYWVENGPAKITFNPQPLMFIYSLDTEETEILLATESDAGWMPDVDEGPNMNYTYRYVEKDDVFRMISARELLYDRVRVRYLTLAQETKRAVS